MRKSKKGMSTWFKIIVVIIAISLFGGVVIKLVGRGRESALDILSFGEDEDREGPASDEFISIASAESGPGKSIELLTSGATEDGDFDEIECGAVAGCPIIIIFDRNIESFSNDYFTVMEKRGWASGWRESNNIIVRSLKDNRLILTGFERGISYFVRFNTVIEYEQIGTGEMFKLNSATVALRFETY